MMGWVCPLCGAANAPHLLQCPCHNGTATDTATTATTAANGAATTANDAATATAITANGTASTVAEVSEVLGSKASSPRSERRLNRYKYNDPDFNEFWCAFPLRRGKAAAYRRWQKVIAAGVAPQVVIAAAASYAAEVDGKDPQFIKWPEGWLNAGRWDDEPATPVSLADIATREIERVAADRDGSE